MGELAVIAETLAKYGAWAIVALLCLVVRAQYQRNNALQDARLADLKELNVKAVETGRDVVHAINALTKIVESK